MLALERYANLKPAELRKIRRQNPKLGQANEEKRDIRRYRRAVADAAAGKLAESFAGLEKLGAVVAWVLAAPARFRLQKNEKGFITQIAVRYLGEEASDAKAEAKAQSQ